MEFSRNTSGIVPTLAATLGAGALAGGALAVWGHRELTNFQLHEYTIPYFAPGELRKWREFRLLHVSDLHMIPGQTEKVEFVRGLADLKPDLVVNTGDNLSDAKAVPWVLRALDPLLSVPGLFVFGSNDYWAPRPVNPFGYLLGRKRRPSYVDLPWEGMRAAFIERGWRNATHARPEFRIGPVKIAAAGVDDPHINRDSFATISGPPNGDSNLQLALLHSPEPRVLDQFASAGYTLALAGHTHGGQIALPTGRAIVTNCGIDRKRASGLHPYRSMQLHVSNGLGTSKYAPIRLFCPPSATLLRLVERPA